MNNQPIESTGYSSAISSRASSPRETPEPGSRLTQPTADKAPVRIEEVTRAQGRTLDELHPRGHGGKSSPPLRHHEAKREITVDDVRQPFEAAARKIEGEAFATIDAFTNEFVGGLGEAEKDLQKIHGGLGRLEGGLGRLEQTIDRGFGGIIDDLRAHSARMQEMEKRHHAGLEESRVTRQNIVESMREENEGYKKLVESMDGTLEKANTKNKQNAAILGQIRANREASDSRRGIVAPSTSANNPAGTGKKTGAELLAELRAKREAREKEGQDKQASGTGKKTAAEVLAELRAKREAREKERQDKQKE